MELRYFQVASSFLEKLVSWWAFNAFFDSESHSFPHVMTSNFIGLEDGQDNVDAPKTAEEDEGAHSAWITSTELTTNFASSDEEADYAENSAENEDHDTEAETSSWHEVFLTMVVVLVQAGNNPWEAKTKEYIHRVRSSHITNCSICVLILLSSCHTGEGIWQRCS